MIHMGTAIYRLSDAQRAGRSGAGLWIGDLDMTNITKIAPDVFRILTLVPGINMQFNQFLVRDEEPLLWHAGLKAHFPLVREAVATLINPKSLRWIGFSHFEADECGSLGEWQARAPRSIAFASGALRPRVDAYDSGGGLWWSSPPFL
jgi:hypothetical protein